MKRFEVDEEEEQKAYQAIASSCCTVKEVTRLLSEMKVCMCNLKIIPYFFLLNLRVYTRPKTNSFCLRSVPCMAMTVQVDLITLAPVWHPV